AGEAEAKPKYSNYLQLDLATVEPCVCGPRISGPDACRPYWPHRFVNLKTMKSGWDECLSNTVRSKGFGILPDQQGKSVTVTLEEGVQIQLKHGFVVIAAITSCTSALNPAEMLTAALVAKKASERGLQVKPYVKTSLAPASNVVTKYLEASGLLPALEGQGFHVVGHDCTTCIGSSAKISESVMEAVSDNGLVAATVRSCSRTSEGHVHPLFRANYLASPPLVVAYALAGTVDINFEEESIGSDKDGNEVFLRDIWPSNEEVAEVLERAVLPQLFQSVYEAVKEGATDALWNSLPADDEIGWRDGTDASSLHLLSQGDSVATDQTSPAAIDWENVRLWIVDHWDQILESRSNIESLKALLMALTHYRRRDGEEHLNALLQACPIPPKIYEEFAADDFEELSINFEEIQAAFDNLQQQVEAERGADAEERGAENEGLRREHVVFENESHTVSHSSFHLVSPAAATSSLGATSAPPTPAPAADVETQRLLELAGALSKGGMKSVEGGGGAGSGGTPTPSTRHGEEHVTPASSSTGNAVGSSSNADSSNRQSNATTSSTPDPHPLPHGVHGGEGGGSGGHSASHTATAAAVAHEGHDEGDGTFVNSSTSEEGIFVNSSVSARSRSSTSSTNNSHASDSEDFLTLLDQQKKQIEANMADNETLHKLIDADRVWKEEEGLSDWLKEGGDKAKKLQRLLIADYNERVGLSNRAVFAEGAFLGVCDKHYELSKLAESRGLLAEERKNTVERLSKEVEQLNAQLQSSSDKWRQKKEKMKRTLEEQREVVEDAKELEQRLTAERDSLAASLAAAMQQLKDSRAANAQAEEKVQAAVRERQALEQRLEDLELSMANQ
ncbi:unnamed protein product, partial [Closterium sp. Yama58-4]